MENNTTLKRSQLREIWKRLLKNRVAVAALVVIFLLCLVALFADLIADYAQSAVRVNPSQRLRAPSSEHIFGTDGAGRDVFARVVHGSRISLTIGILCMTFSLLGGSLLGSVSGFFGGKVDFIIMRITDVFMSLPPLLLALAIVAALGQGIQNLILAISVSQMFSFSRLMRSQVLTLRDNEFIEAARAIGTGNTRIVYLHIIPNAIGPLLVQATISIASAIIAAASLSYVGLGVPPPAPEWGGMLADGREFMRQHIHLVLIPGLAIVISALSFNLFGDGLRDALDPRLKGTK